jgi:hypothetical protein
LLTDAIASYVNTLDEREFDAPFLALLRLQGFTDIHFLHGSFEFGKDFLAKGIDEGKQTQFLFQSKAGDIDLSTWSKLRGQIDMLRTDSLAHPNFDKNLPRKAILVVTGRLVGGAPLAAQQYGEHLKALNELQFSTWDRDSLIDMLARDPVCLSGSSLELLQILGSQHDQLNFAVLEKYSRSWIRTSWITPNLRDSLEAAVIAGHCRRSNRLDLACYIALMLMRSTLATIHSQRPVPETAEVAIATSKVQFRHYARELWDECEGKFLEPDEILRVDGSPFPFVSYPVRCMRILELLGMLGLLEQEIDQNNQVPRKIAEYMERFIEANVGTTHLPSDRWAVSIVAASLLLAACGKIAVVQSFLTANTKWIADCYDEGSFGLAHTHATPAEETAYFLGSPFDYIELRERKESFAASTILDLTSVLELKDLYDTARNEFLAVDIVLPVIETDDDQSQYCLHTGSHRFEPNMPYEEYWKPVMGWKNAPHHGRGVDIYYTEVVGTSWDQLAISCVLRDRFFVKSWRRLLADRLRLFDH